MSEKKSSLFLHPGLFNLIYAIIQNTEQFQLYYSLVLA